MAVTLAASVCLNARPARADKLEELSQVLLHDSSYKVRVQAALVLGKLGDRNAVSALTKALRDDNSTVRAVAAQSLGRLGAPEAVAELKQVLAGERDPFVRTQVEKAIVALGPAPGSAGGSKSKIYLTFGPFSGGSKAADGPSLGILRAALQHELSKLSSVTFELESGLDDKAFARTGRKGFLIDGNVTRLEDTNVGGATETNCDVKVMVARWPSKSIIMWTNAGAAVQGGRSAKDRDGSKRDCLEASAGQLGEDLSKFLQSQGG